MGLQMNSVWPIVCVCVCVLGQRENNKELNSNMFETPEFQFSESFDLKF